MLITFSTDKSLSETVAALAAAVQANHFGLIHVHNLKATLAVKDVALGRDCHVFEVCQPRQAKKMLDQNIGVSAALPCRISVYENDGRTVLATLKPTTLLATFSSSPLKLLAQEVEASILKIMRDATAPG